MISTYVFYEFVENMIVPKWNLYSKELITGTMDLAHEFLADEGFLVTMCLAEHIGELFVDALRVGLTLHRTWTLMCDGHGYRHPVTREAVRVYVELSCKFMFLENFIIRVNHLFTGFRSHLMLVASYWQACALV